MSKGEKVCGAAKAFPASRTKQVANHDFLSTMVGSCSVTSLRVGSLFLRCVAFGRLEVLPVVEDMPSGRARDLKERVVVFEQDTV